MTQMGTFTPGASLFPAKVSKSSTASRGERLAIDGQRRLRGGGRRWIPGAHWTWKLWRALDRHTADVDSPSSGDREADAWDLLQSLYEKIREEMPIRHVERATHGWQARPERRLVGRIE